jgi:hypothetical protein
MAGAQLPRYSSSHWIISRAEERLAAFRPAGRPRDGGSGHRKCIAYAVITGMPVETEIYAFSKRLTMIFYDDKNDSRR